MWLHCSLQGYASKGSDINLASRIHCTEVALMRQEDLAIKRMRHRVSSLLLLFGVYLEAWQSFG